MHIIEINEQLDYHTFMNKGLPDDAGHGEYTRALGNRVWELEHGIARNYGCELCRPGAIMLESAKHDLVNISLGKGVYDPALFIRGVDAYDKAKRTWEKEGKALHKDSPYRNHDHAPRLSHLPQTTIERRLLEHDQEEEEESEVLVH